MGHNYKIDSIRIGKFYALEYPGTSKPVNIGGSNLIIRGKHKTGKSTTFDALMYGFLGYKGISRDIKMADVEIILSNDIETIKIHNRYKTPVNVEIRTKDGSGPKNFNGSEATTELYSKIGGLKDTYMLFYSLMLPQRDEDTILGKYKNEDFNRIVNFFSRSDDAFSSYEEVNNKIKEVELTIDMLNRNLRSVEEKSLETTQEISSTEKYCEDIKNFLTLYENGFLKLLVKELSDNKELAQKISGLTSKNTGIEQDIRKINKKIGELERYYGAQVLDAIKTSIELLTCPVCNSGINFDRLENDISYKKCPYCRTDGYSWELYNKMADKIESAKTELPELREKRDELTDEVGRVKKELQELKSKLKSIENKNISETTVRIIEKLESHDQSYLDTKYDDNKKKLDKLASDLDTLKENAGLLESTRKDLADNKNKLAAERDALILELSKLNEKLNDGAIQTFETTFNETYAKLSGERASKIKYKEGTIILLNKLEDTIRERDARNKHDLSVAERRLLDIALMLTFTELNKKNKRINIDFTIIDDLTEDINDEWKESVEGYIKSITNHQFIILTSEETLFNDSQMIRLQYTKSLFDYT